jgi:hypothetical protein
MDRLPCLFHADLAIKGDLQWCSRGIGRAMVRSAGALAAEFEAGCDEGEVCALISSVTSNRVQDVCVQFMLQPE